MPGTSIYSKEIEMINKENTTSRLLQDASARAIRYLEGLDKRPVAPSKEALESLTALDGPLPEGPSDPGEIIRMLDESGSPGTVASAGPRYFGFVVGGALPVTVAANWLAGAWDQNAAAEILSPTATMCERIAVKWLGELFSMPEGAWGGLVTGATAANFTGLAAARHAVLKRQGWDAAEKGIFGAPKIRVIVGEEAHVSLLIALRVLGFGREELIRLPVDSQGRMLAEAVPDLDEQTIVCLQAGNVNSGAFDPFEEICTKANETGAWVHVDGAFGLWALTSPQYRHLGQGVQKADSWATDAHKWLNVPYDCGVVLCREPQYLAMAMSLDPAGYFVDVVGENEPDDFTLEMSRRGRGIEVWAALSTLGRSGVAEMIERTCRHAQKLSKGLQKEGFEVLNDVVLNQVVVSFGDDDKTRQVIQRVQEGGLCWAGGTFWRGKHAMRISVSSWATTDKDVDMSIEAIIKAAQE